MQSQHNTDLVAQFRERYIKEELPAYLYHYAPIEGFKGIIDSKEIWATVAAYIASDPTELTIAKDIALEILEEEKGRFDGRDELNVFCKNKIENSDHSNESKCICSFTEEKDLLSQWRAYCPKGGVSLCFDTKAFVQEIDLSSPPTINEQYLYKCIYEREQQKKTMRDLFEFLLKQPSPSTPRERGKLESFLSKMIQTFSYSFKHASFKEEKEWRLCYFPTDESIRHRTKGSMQIPYISFSIEPAIHSVMIGPSRDKGNLGKSVMSYLKTSNLPDVSQRVEVTQTPYHPL
ncbi:MAG: DUF2971 domain-containing protein [Phycisphaerae bacterium]|nr:DUF2971 domain-containing protein [Phycisphaerae bacterium]